MKREPFCTRNFWTGRRYQASGFERGCVYADCRAYPELEDLDSRSREESWTITGRLSVEISENFRNGEQYVKILENFQDINTLIAYMSRYLHISGERKYEYLKADSLKERSLLFMDDLLKQKESVQLSMELNEKMTDKANRFYRNQVLREQLKSIQEELKEQGEDEEAGEKRKRITGRGSGRNLCRRTSGRNCWRRRTVWSPWGRAARRKV